MGAKFYRNDGKILSYCFFFSGEITIQIRGGIEDNSKIIFLVS